MAQSTNSKKTTSQTKAAGADTKKRTTSTKQKTPTREEQYRGKHFNGSPKLPAARVREIYLYISFALNVFLFLGAIGLCGVVGKAISGFFFGLFGTVFFPLPFFFFVAAALLLANGPKPKLIKVLVWSFILAMIVGFIFQLSVGIDAKSLKVLYFNGYSDHQGGGIIFGGIVVLMSKLIGKVGAIIVTVLLLVVTVIEITGISLIQMLKSFFSFRYEDQDEYDCQRELELSQPRRVHREREHGILGKITVQDDDHDGIADTASLGKKKKKQIVASEEVHELKPENADPSGFISTMQEELELDNEKEDVAVRRSRNAAKQTAAERKTARRLVENPLVHYHRTENKDFFDLEPDSATYADPLGNQNYYDAERGKVAKNAAPVAKAEESKEESDDIADDFLIQGEVVDGNKVSPAMPSASEMEATRTATDELRTNIPSFPARVEEEKVTKQDKLNETAEIINEISQDKKPEKKYVFPPVTLLKSDGKNTGRKSTEHVRETAVKLKSTLESFGVNVTITNCSVGPTVTRYEMQPEQGVKVSRILNLQDDIKLNLAAADIRIEAPIPGKAAIGIEVPNSESSVVYFRDLVDNDTFKRFKSKLCFAVGKDISGQPIITDIAKMPHLLIAGSTGSGKSVCINTIIMSILYKADPKEVKMIMIDPKMVELTSYNGIPHLLIPVVTDPKKAAGALNWAVQEMTDRYQKFAKYNVRNLEGFNKLVDSYKPSDPENPDKAMQERMPQLLVIVDELADLMMVAHGEVEDSIVRLSQLARAAGIHLVIATQRPSVDVITGLIKANVPSRIAFAVSSGIDSRTILDMNGAEKLLGKGDMLFYPAGNSKPTRVQGAFISDDEVNDVVGFIKENYGEMTYDATVTNKIDTTGAETRIEDGEEVERFDEYFDDAGRLVIEKDKASIGYLQRVFRIGFNRAARIMDQLADCGVVGPEEGTKPRKVLMTLEEFEQFLSSPSE
ncbi:MAG: DNA translocase FtsK [Lachnospiraceae bacterium]|nr:DNA translocase FtsK [Lachnospiraceae bacterium]